MRYEVGPRIGEGGFGVVYAGVALGADGYRREVALKVPRGDLAAEQHARLRDEARFSALVPHRAVVPVQDVVASAFGVVLVMPLVNGVDLDRASGAAPVPFGVVAAIGAEVASGLDSACTTVVAGKPLRLVHRDIKPGNILVTASGEVRVIDFGVARAEARTRAARTATGLFVGTAGYFALDDVDGGAGPAADVFALGVTLAGLLLGRQPWVVGRDEADHDAKVARCLEAVRRTGAPEQVVHLLKDMLDFDAGWRPSAAEVAGALLDHAAPADLRDWARDRVARARVDLPRTAGPLTGQILCDEPTPPSPLRVDVRRATARITWSAVLMGVGLSLLGGTVLGLGGLTVGVAAASQWTTDAGVPLVAVMLRKAHDAWDAG